MAIVTMPALSPTMTEGKLAKWLVKEGDDVRSGDVIAEIETDKAVMEVEALDDGKMASILIAEGTEGVAVGSVIAEILGDGEESNLSYVFLPARLPAVSQLIAGLTLKPFQGQGQKVGLSRLILIKPLQWQVQQHHKCHQYRKPWLKIQASLKTPRCGK